MKNHKEYFLKLNFLKKSQNRHMDFCPFLDLNGFDQLEASGKGSFGKVMKIRNKKNGEIYAAKILYHTIDKYSQTEITDISREVNILAKLNFPSVVKFIGYSPINFKQRPKTTIVIEYAQNGSLSNILEQERNGNLPAEWNATKKLINIYGIASGMSYLHSQNIIHRDLKPENILENEKFYPKISDFGLSKILHQNANSITFQSSTGIKGTQAYTAPEIMEKKKYSKASDVYAFSLILYEIMTKEIPFSGLNFYHLMKNVPIGFRPSFNEQINSTYENLIKRCWSNEPNERPTFEEIVNELKTNKGFITNEIDESEYIKYIDFLDQHESNQKESIDSNSNSNFKGISEEEIVSSLTNDEHSEKEPSKEKTAKEFFNILVETNYLKMLPEEVQEFISNVNQTQSNRFSNILIREDDIDKLYENSTIDRPEFITILNQFEHISIELTYPNSHIQRNLQIIEKLKTKEIPKIYVKVTITEEFQQEFQNNNIINEIDIQAKIKKISNSSFLSCSSLEKVAIPLRVITIEEQSFMKCSSLKTIIIPSSVIKLESHCFSECSSLEEITIPDSVTTIEKQCFDGCSSLKKITIPQNIEIIGEQCFNDCSSLEEVIIESEIDTISDQLFKGCSSLKKIEIPSSVQVIGQLSFSDCSSLEKITIPSSVTQLKRGCFSNCSSLKQIIIPPSVIRLEGNCFNSCSLLDQIIIPESIKSLFDNCFANCISLKKLTIPNSVKIINGSCFYNCTSLEEIILPSKITKLLTGLFLKCTSLKKIQIPESTTEIKPFCFSKCTSLYEITIPETVNKIGQKCFSNCTSLTYVHNNSSVSEFQEQVFMDCKALKSITINPLVNSINSLCFSNCKSLEIITIPSSVRFINKGCFMNCTSLYQIIICSTKITFGKEAFENCSSLTSVTLIADEKDISTDLNIKYKIEKQCFLNCTSLTEITIPLVRSINNFAFEGCSSLLEITIPSSVISIGNYAFNNCSSLAKITILSPNIHLSESTFKNLNSLNEIYVHPDIYDDFRKKRTFYSIDGKCTIKQIEQRDLRLLYKNYPHFQLNKHT